MSRRLVPTSTRVLALVAAMTLLAPGLGATAQLRLVGAALTTSFSYVSAPGDPVGRGTSGTFTPPSATITVSGNYAHVSAQIRTTTDWWLIDIAAPHGRIFASGATFVGASRYPFNQPTEPGLSVGSTGTGCNQDFGSFTVNQIGADFSGEVNTLDLDFTQTCDSTTAPPLMGHLQYQVGLVEPPPPARLPSSFSYVSQAGDPVGTGSTAILSAAAGASFSSSGTLDGVTVTISTQTARWSISIAAPAGRQLAVGSYPDAASSPSPTQAKLSVSSNYFEGSFYGNFTVNQIRANQLLHVDLLDLNLVQQSGSATGPSLTGHLLFQIGLSEPPLPSGLPTSYSFTSDDGDYVGAGQASRYTPFTRTDFSVSGNAGDVTIQVEAPSDNWSIELAAPRGSVLAPGTYLDATEAPFRSGTSPGIDVWGDGRSCDNDFGQFSIESIRTDAFGTVSELAATFTQHCESPTAPALRGAILYNPPTATSMTLSASAGTIRFGQQLTFTAVVSPSPQRPTGPDEPVGFWEGTNSLGSVDLVAGKSTLDISSLPRGIHTITAKYSGDGLYEASQAEISVAIWDRSSQPTLVTASPDNHGGITVRWGRPEDDGGAPVQEYEVYGYCSPSGASSMQLTTKTSLDEKELPAGSCTFTVIAWNGAWSPWSDWTPWVAT